MLRPDGGVGIVWNVRDCSVGWVDRVWTIMDRVEEVAPWRDHENRRTSALGERPAGRSELRIPYRTECFAIRRR